MTQGTNEAKMIRQARRSARVTTAGCWLCIAAAALGVCGLLGWLVNSPTLYTLVPGQPPMMPNTAIALMVAGICGAVYCRDRPGSIVRIVVSVAALVPLAIGLGTLIEYAGRVDLGIDQLLLYSDRGPYPGRPSPLTAMGLAMLGGALLVFDAQPAAETRLSEWLLIAAGLTAMVGLTGQILGTGEIYRLPSAPVVGMAVPTAVSLLLSSCGMLLARPRTGIIAVATSDGPGGILLRRIAAPSVVVPMLLGFGIVRLFAVLNVDEFPLVVASVSVTITAAGLAVLVLTARLLNEAHRELETSRERTREVIALASDPIFIADLSGRYSEVNQAACRLLGMTESEIVGRTIRDLIQPDEVGRLAASRAALLEGGSQVGEWHLRHKSGRYIPVEVSARILPGGRWQGIVRDISRRKAAEAEARRTRARIEGSISIATDAIISIDEEYRITIFNHGAEHTFGWTAREAIGQSLDILIPERFRGIHRSHVRAFAAEGVRARRTGERGSTIYGLRKDGTEFIAEASISKLRIDGESTFTVVLRDVTLERRRMAHDRLLAAIGPLLTSSLERKQVVREAARLLVSDFADACVIDLVDDPSTPLSVTRSAVLHRDPGKTETALALERIELDRRRPHLASESLQTGRTILVAQVTPEYLDSISQSPEHRRLLQQLAPASLITVPLQARGLLLGVLTFVSSDPEHRYDQTDVAFVKEIALRLALLVDNARLFETATNAITARDEILRIVAHDLRNPLGTILMRASLLRDTPGPNGDRRKTAVAIETAANRMNRLIRDLLDVTRFEVGQLSVEQAPVSARAVVNEAVAAQQTLASSASLDLRAELCEDLPDVNGDRDRLLQIFENLIGNAIKFTPPGGRITVSAAARGNEVLFCVKDTGHGIPAEDLPHVFDRFWQGRRQKRAGAGLGLLIVKALVEAHGGRVRVHSAPGHGSTFFFTIPVAVATATR